MIPIARDAHPANNSASSGRIRIGTQPIVLTAAALCLILAGVASIAIWRVYTGHSPETDRAVAARALQARTAQASEQLVEKTKGLEATQQESIDQLQVVQDQLSTVRRLLAWFERMVPQFKVVLISWFGGEPLLSFRRLIEIQQEVKRMCEDAGVAFNSHITTNGYLLSPERAADLIRGRAAAVGDQVAA